MTLVHTELPDLVRDFKRIARQYPSLTAIRVYGDRELSFASLANRVSSMVETLAAMGAVPRTVVRIRGGITPWTLTLVVAAWEMGCIVWFVGDEDGSSLPIYRENANGASPSQAPELSYIEASVGDSAGYLSFSNVSTLPFRERQVVHEAAHITARGEDRPAYIVASSGSTGQRKFILGSYLGLSHFCAWQRDMFGISSEDTVACLTNVTFDVVLREFVTPLVSGASISLPPARMRPSEVLEYLRTSSTTVVNIVPSLARMWLRTTIASRVDSSITPNLRLSFFAGEPLDGQLVARWRANTGVGQAVYNLYGPSETTLAKFSWCVPLEKETGVCPVGWPIDGAIFRIETPDTRQRVEVGEVGEVIIETLFASYGYLGTKSADLTAAFQDSRETVTFRTGDLGRIGRSGLELVGRIGSTMKINGEWVDRAVVEAALRAIPAVDEAVVIAFKTRIGTRIRAFVVSQKQIDRQELRTVLRRSLGSASIPTSILVLESLPRLATGKIAIAELQRIADGLQEGGVMNTNQSQKFPSEIDILECVTKTAGTVLDSEISPDVDLFDFGLDSLSALELSAVLEDTFPLECSPNDIFDHPVPQALAAMLVARISQIL